MATILPACLRPSPRPLRTGTFPLRGQGAGNAASKDHAGSAKAKQVFARTNTQRKRLRWGCLLEVVALKSWF